MKRVAVVGSGFGALSTIRELRKRDGDVEITMIAPRAELIYLPSLIWIPTGLRKPEDLRVDLSRFLLANRVKHVAARVTGLESGGRLVRIDNGDSMENDGLVIASGGRFIKRLPGIEHTIALCEGIDAAERIHVRLNTMQGGTLAFGFGPNPHEPQAVRGGPVFELLFGIDAYLRQQGRRNQFTLVFFNGSEQPGARLGERAVKKLLDAMHRREIKTYLGHKPVRFEPGKVVTEREEIDADLILFMPGMTGPEWAENSGLTLSPGGMIKADQHTLVEGTERVYVVGDSGSFPGPDWMPKQAHMADLQAAAAAQNLLNDFAGKPASATFKTELICIVDMLGKGVLVYRSPTRTLVTPPSRLLHAAKRLFEKQYLSRYRNPKPLPQRAH
nr:FAD-dependent oxidoreductase [Acidihalobacter aeolianus]